MGSPPSGLQPFPTLPWGVNNECLGKPSRFLCSALQTTTEVAAAKVQAKYLALSPWETAWSWRIVSRWRAASIAALISPDKWTSRRMSGVAGMKSMWDPGIEGP